MSATGCSDLEVSYKKTAFSMMKLDLWEEPMNVREDGREKPLTALSWSRVSPVFAVGKKPASN